MSSITKAVVQTDQRLEKAAEGSRLDLAKHRWHWTLDESNPMRVSMREYAREVGRTLRAVQNMVNAFVAWTDEGALVTQYGDFEARAAMSGARLAATEAVAEAKGISLESARRHHADEVRSVKAVAQERAEQKGTTTEEEVTRVARTRQAVRHVEAKAKADKKEAHTLRYIQAEGNIAQAMSKLRLVLDDTEGVEFTSEERELVARALGQLRAVLNLLDMRIVGTADIDWDSEMKKLGDKS